MQPSRSVASPTPSAPSPAPSPAVALGQHLRWQVVLALAGILLLVSLLGISTASVATVRVPDQGGVFREGVAGNPRDMNPLLCGSDVDKDLCSLLYRGLTRVDKNGRVVPDLAESWSVTNDGTDYTFRIKPEQYWHDGQPVTVEDVLFTIGVLQSPEVFGLPDLTALWRSVRMERLDEMTVRFVLSEPFTPFLDYTSIGLLPQHIFSGSSPSSLTTAELPSAIPVGTGPLRYVTSGANFIRFEPNPFYSESTPYLSALEFRFYPDSPSLFAAFQADEIDGVRRILPSDVDEASNLDEMQLFSSTESLYLNVVLNLNSPDLPFFQEKTVRQALLYGLDRQALIDDVAAGQGRVAHSPLMPENWAYNNNVVQYSYDPERAARLLDEAGWIDSNGDGVRDKNGRPLQFLLYGPNGGTQEQILNKVAEDWMAIGVRAAPTPVTLTGLMADFVVPRQFEAALLIWDLSGDPDPYPLWHSLQAEGGGQNFGGWRNERVDEVLREARAINDQEARRQLYAEFQTIFADEVPAILLYYPIYTYGVSDRVHNVQLGSINDPSDRFRTFADWYIVTKRVPINQVPTSAPPTPPSN